MIRVSIDISVITNNQEIMLNLLFLEKQHLLNCNLAYERILNASKIAQIWITIGEGLVSKLHYHFRLPFIIQLFANLFTVV